MPKKGVMHQKSTHWISFGNLPSIPTYSFGEMLIDEPHGTHDKDVRHVYNPYVARRLMLQTGTITINFTKNTLKNLFRSVNNVDFVVSYRLTSNHLECILGTLLNKQIQANELSCMKPYSQVHMFEKLVQLCSQNVYGVLNRINVLSIAFLNRFFYFILSKSFIKSPWKYLRSRRNVLTFHQKFIRSTNLWLPSKIYWITWTVLF